MIPVSNRRVSSRKVLRRPATVSLAGGVERLVHTWDVGLDGLSLVSAKPIPPGTRCTVRLELPDAGTMRVLDVPIKTVYCSLLGPEGVKVGSVFLTLDEDTERVIRDFLA